MKKIREIMKMPAKTRMEVLNKMSKTEIVESIKNLDPDEAMHILRYLHKRKRTNILEDLNKNLKEKVERMLTLNEKKAGELLSLDYISVKAESSFKQILQKIKVHERRSGKMPVVLVLNAAGKLQGELPIKKMLTLQANDIIHPHLKKIPAIHEKSTQKTGNTIFKIFAKHPHGKVVLLDDEKGVLGILYSEDILKFIANQNNKSLQKFAGIKKEEDILDNTFSKVKHRYHWLIINLFTAFLAAGVIGIFEPTLEKMVLLAAYLPIVAGMGGNAATQTLAVTVRGMALGEITKENMKSVVIKESLAGTINGVITGIVAAMIAMLWNNNPMLGLVIGMSMVFNLFIAGFFGTIIPIIMKSLGKDPASSATIFITTATDIFGFLAFLGLASVVLL